MSQDNESDHVQDATNKDLPDSVHEVPDTVATAYDETTEKQVLRKINTRLLPLMVVSYLLQYLDKTTLGYSAIMGIQEDLHLVGQEYSWVSSIFYFGYLFATYPASFGFVKFPIGKFLSVTMVLWAVILTLHAVAKDFAGIMVLRVLLGVLESVVSPGFSLLTAMYWKRSEHPLVHGIWYAGNGVAGFFGGLIAYGIGHIQGHIASWQYLFIIFGLVTFVWSIVLFIYLPDDPSTAKFLTPVERQVAQLRVQAQQHSVNEKKYKKYQIIEALTDPKAWMISLFMFLTAAPAGALSNFSSIIIKGFGFTTLQTLLVNMPPAVIVIIYGIGGTYFVGKVPRTRCIMLALFLTQALVGVLLIRQLPEHNRIGRLWGVYLFNSTGATLPIMLSLMASNISGYTKKTVVNAMFFVAYCVGNISSPQFFKAKEAPSYPSAFLTLIICLILGIITAISLWAYMGYENRRRDKKYGIEIDPYKALGAVDLDHVDVSEALSDLTDKETERTFRYMY